MNARPTEVIVNLDNLRHNIKVIKNKIGNTKFMAVIKADAYGHGMIQYAKVLSKQGVDYFGVAIVEEGITLRKAGIKEPILILGDIVEEQIDFFFEHDLSFTIASDSKMIVIDERAQYWKKKACAHLKIDTGMGRIGVNWQRVDKYINAIKKCHNINWQGVFTHLARADENREYSDLQFERFQKAVHEIERNSGVIFPIKHIANSSATCLYPHMYMDMVRIGIMLHGAYPSTDFPGKLDTKPVMRFHTRVVYFKTMNPNEYVSYGSTWSPKELNTRIATLPLGYADGYGRRFDNKTEVIIREKKYSIVGRVCMDQCMVNLGTDGEAYPGDEVVLIGNQENEEITVEELAEQMGTISYDIFIKISKRVPRIYINE